MADYSLGTAHGKIQIDADTSGVDQADQALGRLNKSAQTTEQAMGSASRGMGIAGAAIAGGLGLAVKSAMDFDATLSGIKAVSGATAGEMDKIRDAALRIGADTAFSATQAAEAMAELSKAGVSTEDILGGVADATVALAAATGIDLPSAATYASDTMNMFNLQASDMDSIVNTLAQTANASSIDMNDMGMAMSQVGAVANLAGLSVQDTAMAIGQMGDAGIKGSDAGTSLKTMLMNLQPSTKAQADAMRELGIITEDGTNQFYNQDGSLKSLRDIQEILRSSTAGLTDQQKQMALETIFGSDAIRAAAVMADGGAASYDAFGKKMSETGTAAEQAKIRQDNLKGSVEQLKGSLETMAISIGTALTPMIRGLADGLMVLVNWFNSLSPTTQSWIAGILASAAALLLLTAGVLKVVMMFKSLYTTMVALRLISTATQASWIALAFTGIANFVKLAASAVVSAATTATAWVVAAAQSVAAWVLMAAQATLNALKVGAAWLLTTGASMITAMAQFAVAVATTVAGWVLMGVQALLQAAKVALAWFIALGPIGWAIAALLAVIAFVIIFWDDIVAFFKAGAEKVAGWMQAAWQWIQQAWDAILNAFRAAGQWISDIMSSIGQWIADRWNAIVSFFQSAGQNISNIMSNIVSWIQGAWNSVVAAFQAAGQAILNALNAAWNWVTSIWNNIVGFLRQIPGWIGGVFASAASWLVNAGMNILYGLANGIWSGASAVWNGLSGIVNGVIGWFGGAYSWLVSAGKNLLIGLWNGISSMGGWLWSKITGWANSIISGIKSFFGISSPSKLFAEFGENLSMGLAIGIDDSAYQATRAALEMAQAVAGNVSMTAGGSDAFWDATALGSGSVPRSNEVASYSDAQGASRNSGEKVIQFITNNPIAERASDTEARRLRALSALGAF